MGDGDGMDNTDNFEKYLFVVLGLLVVFGFSSLIVATAATSYTYQKCLEAQVEIARLAQSGQITKASLECSK